MGTLRRYAGLRWIWIGQLLSQLGNAVFQVMGLWELQLRSPYLLSAAALAMVVPSLLAAVGGVIVDHYDAARIMLWTDVLRGTAVLLGIAALVLPGSLVPVVIALLAVNSLGNALFGPAESLLVPRLVKDEDLPAANGVYSLTQQISPAIGSAIGGAAIAALGVGLVFGFDMASFWISALAIWLMIRVLSARPPRPASAPAADPSAADADPATSDGQGTVGLVASMREGFTSLRRLPALLPLLPIILLGNLAFMAAFTLLPYWIRGTLHGDAFAYGLITAAFAAGMVLGGLTTGFFGKWPIRVSSALMFTVSSLAIGMLAFTRSVPITVALMLFAGVTNGIGNALLFTLIQRLTPDAMRGRVFGLIFTLFGLASPVGAVLSNLFIHAIPIALSWIFGAVCGVANGVGLWVTVPRDLAVTGEPTPAD